MVDNWGEIADFFQLIFAVLFMRAVDLRGIPCFKFLDVFPDVVAVRIKLGALGPWVEDSEPGARIVSGTNAPLPTSNVRGKIPVD